MPSDPVCWGTPVLCFPHDFPQLFLKLSFRRTLLKLKLWGCTGPHFPSLSQQLYHFLPWIIQNTLFLLFHLRVKAHLFFWSLSLILESGSQAWNEDLSAIGFRPSTFHQWWSWANSKQSSFPRGLQLWLEELQTSSLLGELQQNVSSACQCQACRDLLVSVQSCFQLYWCTANKC